MELASEWSVHPKRSKWFVPASDSHFFPCMVEIDCNWSTPSSTPSAKKIYWHLFCFWLQFASSKTPLSLNYVGITEKKSGRQGRSMPAASPSPQFRVLLEFAGAHPQGHHFAASEFMQLGIKYDNVVGPNCISKNCYLTRQWTDELWKFAGHHLQRACAQAVCKTQNGRILFCLAQKCHSARTGSEISLHCAPRASVQLTLKALKEGSEIQKMWKNR